MKVERRLLRGGLIGLAALAGLYAVLLVGLVFGQRTLIYPGAGQPAASAAEAGLPTGPEGFQDVVLQTPDGEQVRAWYRAPRPGRAVILYFHGNGGSLLNRRERASLLTEDGRGLLLASYRGYSGSTGRPTEEGLVTDARTAHAWLSPRLPPERIVLYGESLGSGVALRLAADRPVAGVVLDGAFTSLPDAGRPRWWFVPLDLLMVDQLRSIDVIGRLRAPLLMLHGAEDRVVPIALGRRLFAAAPEPKRFVALPGAGHGDVLRGGGLEPLRAFLGEAEARWRAGAGAAEGAAP